MFTNHAAVLIVVCEDEDCEKLLLTKRAIHLNIHGGEVAFPGGKWEHGDSDLCTTALRESFEEVGLLPGSVEITDELPIHFTRSGLPVKPYVGKVEQGVALNANDSEIESIFWVPIEYLMQDPRIRTDIFVLSGREVWAPVYEYDGFVIWGFTARVIVEFLNSYCGLNICRQHISEEVLYSQ